MHYESYSLNGAWDMAYSRDAYHTEQVPDVKFYPVENAVPGYWEDMTDIFAELPFYYRLNQTGYGIWKYPITHDVPDMSLPAIEGNFFYKKLFTINNGVGDTEIYFEGVQNKASVWLNGTYLGSHEGYSTPFAFRVPADILIEGENELIMSVSNFRLKGNRGAHVSGLTTRAVNEHSGGITGLVELRVYSSGLRDVNLTVSKDCRYVFADVNSKLHFTWQVCCGEEIVKQGEADGSFSFDTDGMVCWSPECPKLYTLRILCGASVMERKFGVRSLSTDGVHLRLNGYPCYLRGVCEHCYFPDTVHPHHDISSYRDMIRRFKQLGFNFIRFHTYIPPEEYMQAADELGMLLHVEAPNNTSIEEWYEIVRFCRRHTSVVLYCCGNELSINEEMISYLESCAEVVHKETDALFSPMSALRCVEYCMQFHDKQDEVENEPFPHHPERLSALGKFSDVYNSYAQGTLSYISMDANQGDIDRWSSVYNKPRLSHEICIDGTYTDLSLKDRYYGTRIGKTEMFASIEKHLKEKGLLQKAPLFFNNSSEWQRRVRKYCFETIRKCNNMAGFDFLGPIDTHWHTFGYDVGMMNEFYELKPGETVRNVLMYNSESVLLSDIGRNTNLYSGAKHSFELSVSYFGKEDLQNAELNMYIVSGQNVLCRKRISVSNLESGCISDLYSWDVILPTVDKPCAAKLYATLDGEGVFIENEWEIYIFPKAEEHRGDDIIISEGMELKELIQLLQNGKDVVLFGTEPFVSLPTTFRISLAGRTSGNLATAINDHPVFEDIPHEGFCGWQFNHLLEDGRAICFESDEVPFEPIVEVASTHKHAVRQAIMFECSVLNGRLFVCGFKLNDKDSASQYLKAKIIDYVHSDKFNPKLNLTEKQLYLLTDTPVTETAGNTNFAFNKNDITD